MDDEESSLCCQELIEITKKQKRPICITAAERFRDACLKKKKVLGVFLIQRGRGRGKISICAAPAADLYASFHFLGALRQGAYYLFAFMTWRKQVKNKLRIVPSCVLTAIRKKLVFLPSSGNSIAYRVGSVWTEVQHSLSFRLDRLLDTMFRQNTLQCRYIHDRR